MRCLPLVFILTTLALSTEAFKVNWASDSLFSNVVGNLENLLNLRGETLMNDINANDDHSANFIQQIDEFEGRTEFHASFAGNDGINYYKDDTNLPYSLEQYEKKYILRLYDWNNDLFFDKCLMLSKSMGVSIWEKSVSHSFIDLQVDRDSGLSILEQLTDLGIYYKSSVIILDLPQAIYETFPQSSNDMTTKDLSISGELFFKNYRDLETIYAWYDLLVDSYPDILNIEYIGNTFEGRPMKALRLSVHSENKKGSKSIKTVVITSGLHAREWISVSTSCYILFELLSDYDNQNSNVVSYLENLDFLFLPVMNPDGYSYTWKNDRLWRKNKQKTMNPRCPGIDIDHSFNFHFTSGAEPACSDDYSGESAFEALESYNWDNYLNETRHTHPIYAYIDLHSYAQEILYPYAYSCDILPRDEENLLELAYGLGQSIRLKTGKYYEVIKACEDKGADFLPSMGSGSALDYMYHNKAYWAFVLKLRDSGTHGFLLPSKYIVPVGEEIYASVKYFSSFILNDN